MNPLREIPQLYCGIELRARFSFFILPSAKSRSFFSGLSYERSFKFDILPNVSPPNMQNTRFPEFADISINK
jgi:hypothetical protein